METTTSKKTSFSVSIFVVLAGFLAFLPLLILSTALSAFAATVNVTVEDFDFNPATVNINTGDTVHWTWTGSDHSVTSTVCHEPFDSTVQNAGFTYDKTFATAGDCHYECVIH